MVFQCNKCGRILSLDDDLWVDDEGVVCENCIDPQKICKHDFEEIILFTSKYKKCKKCGKEDGKK